MESSINQRFNNSLKILITQGHASTKKEIAEKMGVSPQYFTELVKDRIKLSLDFIKKYTNTFPVNLYYLMGDSDDALCTIPTSNRVSSMVSEPEGAYTTQAKEQLKNQAREEKIKFDTGIISGNCPTCADKERIIALQNDYVNTLKQSLSTLRDRIDDLENRKIS